MRHSNNQPVIHRSSSLGKLTARLSSPLRSAPSSPDGASLRASFELMDATKGDIRISKKIVVANAISVRMKREKKKKKKKNNFMFPS